LTGIIDSLKKLAAFLIFLVILAVSTIILFDLFVAQPINLPVLFRQTGDLVIVLAFSITVIVFLRRMKPLLAPHMGLQASTILQFVLLAIASLVMLFAVLDVFGVPLSTLLTGAGIISITIGLVISTFVGGLLSGALVFTTYQFRIGEDVMVNNVPGKVSDMTALVMRIRTDVGQITIPNSAIASGSVIITSVRKPEAAMERRMHFGVGDRVVTAFQNEEGVVKEITAFHTTILLDSGREITYLNNTILSGAVVVARITQKPSSTQPLPERTP
jgi:small-conductance mechanosensitive channel